MNNKRRTIQLLVAVMVMYVALQQIAAQQARTSYPLYERGHTNYHEGVLFSTNATGRIFVRDPSGALEAVNYRTLTNYVALFGGSSGNGHTNLVSVVVVRPTDWVWGRGGSTISNAIAPVWFHQRTAARSVSGLSWVSAVTNAPHGRYMSAEPQFLELAHDWGTNWAFRIWLSASTTSVDTNRFDVRVTAPNGEQWITNNHTVAQANTILPLDVPTNAFSAYMVGSGATNRWVIEMEVWSRAGTSSTVHNVESVLKVIR